MVLLIFEGVDNLGKSTIINKLANLHKDFYDITLIHATAPKCKEGEDPGEVQALTFKQMFTKCNNLAMQEFVLTRCNKNIVFMDRSHIGEYVYGQIYRNGNPDKIMTMIKDLHNGNNFFTSAVIHLEASPEFVVYHDDSKSFTSDYEPEKRLQTVKKEIDLFNEAMQKLNPQNYIKINVEGENYNYRNIDVICSEILSKLHKLNIEEIQ